VATGQHQMRDERRVCLVQGSIGLPCGRQKAALKKAARISEEKDECQVRLKGRERDYSMHRGRHAWRLWVSGPSNGR